MTSSLLGGIGLTYLTVYHDPPGPDGVHGGCAHIHAITPEAYFGVSGEGAIELHDLEHGFRRHKIRKGTFIQFPPGTLHRSVSTDNLEVVAIMGNDGLAERGDARIYFGRDADEKPGEYERLHDLAKQGRDGAIARRNASTLAYADLLRLWTVDKDAYSAELSRFISVHRNALAENIDELRQAIQKGPEEVVEQALHNLSSLTSEKMEQDFNIASCETFEDGEVFGMCGTLRQVNNLREI